MKNIKFNHDRLLKNIAKFLVASSLLLLRFPCILVGYEPANPKLKTLKMKD